MADYWEEFVTGRPGVVLARDKDGNPTAVGMNGDRARTERLMARKAHIHMPSAEGQPGCPADLLAMSKDELQALVDAKAGKDER